MKIFEVQQTPCLIYGENGLLNEMQLLVCSDEQLFSILDMNGAEIWQGELQKGKLVLSKTPQHVALVFFAIRTHADGVSAVFFLGDGRVVPCDDLVTAKTAGKLAQKGDFDVAIAHHAGVGGATKSVAFGKIVLDHPIKALFAVDLMQIDAQLLCRGARGIKIGMLGKSKNHTADLVSCL